MENTSVSNITNLKDESIFENVFRSYYSQLVAYAYQYVSDSDLSEELVQEMFTNLWQKVDDIEIRTSTKSYLYGAVRNACLNYIKHQGIVKRHKESEKYNIDYQDTDFLELDELQSKIDEALNKLPPKCREIFELSRFEDLKYKEIAVQLNISIKTVEGQMGRALKVMRECLGDYLSILIVLILSIIQKMC